MPDIVALLQCLRPHVNTTTIRQWSQIIIAILAMSGRVTMRGISRWTEKGGSYRTVQRFFQTFIPWTSILWAFFYHYLFHHDEAYLLAGDEVVVTKSGKKTYGADRFFSSLYGRTLPGLSFFALSLVSIERRWSFPISIEQVIKSSEEKVAVDSKKKAKKSKKQVKKNKGGRPKGSKNKNKFNVVLTLELKRIKGMIEELIKRIRKFVPLTYLVLDGHFGNNNASVMSRQLNLHLISKLRQDSALYIPYQNPDPNKVSRRKYGSKIDYNNIPKKKLKKSTTEEGIQTSIYQLSLLHKEFAQPLNVVVIVKTNLTDKSRTHIILFSTDLELSSDKLIDYYSLRFQIEFNFRDAKQFWGLEDFMNVGKTAVTNAANLSFFMVNFSHYLLHFFPQQTSSDSVNDLKARFRGYKYVSEIIKLLPEKPDPVLLRTIFHHISCLGCIHPVSLDTKPS